MKQLYWMWRLFKVWDQERQLPPRAGAWIAFSDATSHAQSRICRSRCGYCYCTVNIALWILHCGYCYCTVDIALWILRCPQDCIVSPLEPASSLPGAQLGAALLPSGIKLDCDTSGSTWLTRIMFCWIVTYQA